MLDFGKLIEEMENRMFSDELYDTMLRECSVMKDTEIFAKDYFEATSALKTLISPENLELLAEAEQTAFNYYRYSLKYSFGAGMYTGFEQIFSPKPIDMPFKSRIIDELLPAERMMRHTRYYKLRKSTIDAFEKLHALSDDNEIGEHITSVDAAWEQWEHSALYLGFFLGYRYAMFICEKIDHKGKPKATPRILSVEYELGFCHTTEELEILKRGQSDEDRDRLGDKFIELIDMVNSMNVKTDDETKDDVEDDMDDE